jgi:DNA polymerase/3'-5' exonuclease PolX
MILEQAETIATRYVELLRPYCSRIEVAGSVRRKKPEVHDIELVAIPTDAVNMQFKLEWESGSRRLKGGSKYQQYALPEGINLDLFLVTPPAQFGVIFTLRTGPAEFSTWCVTRRALGGRLPKFAMVNSGAVWVKEQIVPMPEEIDFLSFLGLGLLEPWERKAP